MKSTKLLSVRVSLAPHKPADMQSAKEWRGEYAGNDNYTSPKGLLATIRDIQTENPFQRYPYHTLFAYAEINKAAKR